LQHEFAFESIQLRLPEDIEICCRQTEGLTHDPQRLFNLSLLPVAFSEKRQKKWHSALGSEVTILGESGGHFCDALFPRAASHR
jgi:hypothetical protein